MTPEPLVLGFDTATPAVTVAVHDGRTIRSEVTTVDAMRHGELLAPQITQALVEAGVTVDDLTEIGVGVGPGPFTGLRIGLVTARTLGGVLGIPVHGVCTLDVIAAAVPQPPPVFGVATDARRKEVYWARYATGDRNTGRDDDTEWSGMPTRVEGPLVTKPAGVATADPVAGRGAVLYPEAFGNPLQPPDPSAGVLAGLVATRAVPLLEPAPLYLRRPDAAVPAAVAGHRSRGDA